MSNGGRGVFLWEPSWWTRRYTRPTSAEVGRVWHRCMVAPLSPEPRQDGRPDRDQPPRAEFLPELDHVESPDPSCAPHVALGERSRILVEHVDQYRLNEVLH